MNFRFKGNTTTTIITTIIIIIAILDTDTASPAHMVAFITRGVRFVFYFHFTFGFICQAYGFSFVLCIPPRDGGLASAQVCDHFNSGRTQR
ncbi:hypothetical protein F4824DRAFT_445258 [Ustulina deusta]|nr:hypothetical protein F4824DRAFT_445258 [Ustulina deusta]